MSVVWGVTVCLALALAYVGSLYLLPARIRTLSRDAQAPYRIVTVTSACIVCVWATKSVLPEATSLGYQLEGALGSAVRGVALVAILYQGEFLYWILYSVSSPGSFMSNLKILVKSHLPSDSIIAVRNLIVAPVSEEIVFRSCMAPILLHCGVSPSRVVLYSPLLFGVAHGHHVIENVRTGTPLANAILMCIFQLLYTSLFGIFAAFLLLRTGSIASSIAAHTFCNFLTLPTVSSSRVPKHYLIAGHVFGAVCFYNALFPLTEGFSRSLWH